MCKIFDICQAHELEAKIVTRWKRWKRSSCMTEQEYNGCPRLGLVMLYSAPALVLLVSDGLWHSVDDDNTSCIHTDVSYHSFIKEARLVSNAYNVGLWKMNFRIMKFATFTENKWISVAGMSVACRFISFVTFGFSYQHDLRQYDKSLNFRLLFKGFERSKIISNLKAPFSLADILSAKCRRL